MENPVKTFWQLPVSTQRLLGIGITLALFLALPLFVWAIITQRFELRRYATGEPGPSPSSGSDTLLLNELKMQGCVWSNLVASYDPNIAGHLNDEFVPMLGRSGCKFLYRSIETWGSPPDFGKISTDIATILRQTGKDYIYQMMLAEAVPTAYSSKFPSEYNQFNFSSMCSDIQPINPGSDLCIPSLEKSEYRRYLEYIIGKALDQNVNAFLFGQVYFQDPKWQTSPQIPAMVEKIRQIAASKNKGILIGAQTNHIADVNYLKAFDHIDGGVFLKPDGTVDYAVACREGGSPNPNSPSPNHPWWNCAAHLWNPLFLGKANHVVISLDWESQISDDMHQYAAMSESSRRQLVYDLKSKISQTGATYLPTYLAPLGGDRRSGACFGLYPWIYSAAKQGADIHDQYNTVPPGPYSCKDENWLPIQIATPTPTSPPSSSPTAGECEVCEGLAGLACAPGLTCLREIGRMGNPDQGGICVKPDGSSVCVSSPTPTPTCVPMPSCVDGVDDGKGNILYCDPAPLPPGQTYCPRPTRTPTPTPTSTPAILSVAIKLKFAGVTDGSADGAKITVRFVSSSADYVTPPIGVTYLGNGIYQGNFAIQNPSTYLSTSFKYSIIVKGEKHIGRKFCRSFGQTARCTGLGDITIPFGPGTMDLDFTGIPLEPGDVYPQDGQADANDFAKVKAALAKLCSALSAEEKLAADLDYSGCVTVKDAFLMRKTLEVRYDEE